jgi:hypothetical protein
MPHEYQPAVGEWFKDISGRTFEIVAVDEATVGIQYFDGDLAEVDMDVWFEMDLQSIPEPEDWSGPYDNLGKDDFADSGAGLHPEDWNGPFDEIERDEY